MGSTVVGWVRIWLVCAFLLVLPVAMQACGRRIHMALFSFAFGLFLDDLSARGHASCERAFLWSVPTASTAAGPAVIPRNPPPHPQTHTPTKGARASYQLARGYSPTSHKGRHRPSHLCLLSPPYPHRIVPTPGGPPRTEFRALAALGRPL